MVYPLCWHEVGMESLGFRVPHDEKGAASGTLCLSAVTSVAAQARAAQVCVIPGEDREASFISLMTEMTPVLTSPSDTMATPGSERGMSAQHMGFDLRSGRLDGGHLPSGKSLLHPFLIWRRLDFGSRRNWRMGGRCSSAISGLGVVSSTKWVQRCWTYGQAMCTARTTHGS